MKQDMTRERVRTFTRAVARKNGWLLNPDGEFLETIEEGLLENARRLGYFQCPCRISWDDRSRDRDIVCPCDYSHPDIREYGHCYCALFLSREFSESGAEPAGIPERRPEEYYP